MPTAARAVCTLPRVVLSDKSLREELENGGIVVEPLAEDAIQPSSIDVRVDRYFRVFRNDTTPYIDPKQPQEDLTELVEVDEGKAFILHPGEFVLGSTLERVSLKNDLVGRLDGKSSLGRLGLLIHSSLPGSEPVMVEVEGRLEPRPISEVVEQRLEANVVAFDPETLEVGYHPITGWYEGPPDRIYEVRLASGRKVRATAGHNLFTLDRDGRVAKTRTLALNKGTLVAIPRSIPDSWDPAETIEVLELAPNHVREAMTCSGPTVAAAFEREPNLIRRLLDERSIKHFSYYRKQARLPLPVAEQIEGVLDALTQEDRLAIRGARAGLPPWVDVDPDLAWLLGLYVAEGFRRRNQAVWSNTNQAILYRTEAVLQRLGVPTYRGERAITACSAILALVLEWIGTGAGAHDKRVPPMVFGWPRELIEHFFEGLVDGDDSRDETRVSVWTCSDGLAADVLLLAERMGRRAGSALRRRPDGGQLWQIYLPHNEHKLLTSVPLPDRLLIEMRKRAGLTLRAASVASGYGNPSDVSNIEQGQSRDAVRLATLRRLRVAYARRPECSEQVRRLDRLLLGGLLWDRVVEVRDTGSAEPIYDLEVKPDGRRIENFLAGDGGIFLSNTAGFVDPGFEGHLTLELSNVANLPIAIYPGMKIGQMSFVRMTTDAENPYGSEATGSKYKGQKGPTASRYYLNFKR
jgi:deoxycytidine triphosphate deaminase/intein/homing endonuclease